MRSFSEGAPLSSLFTSFLLKNVQEDQVGQDDAMQGGIQILECSEVLPLRFFKFSLIVYGQPG